MDNVCRPPASFRSPRIAVQDAKATTPLAVFLLVTLADTLPDGGNRPFAYASTGIIAKGKGLAGLSSSHTRRLPPTRNELRRMDVGPEMRWRIQDHKVFRGAMARQAAASNGHDASQ